VHVSLSTVLGYLAAIRLPPLLGIEQKWGVAGLTAAAGVAAFVEFSMLRRTLNRRIGHTGLQFGFLITLWCSAGVGAAVGWAFKLGLPTLHPILLAAFVLGSYGVTYFGITYAAGLAESRTVINRFLKMAKIKRF
jgi:putative peptidoglycan lipid II flippase